MADVRADEKRADEIFRLAAFFSGGFDGDSGDGRGCDSIDEATDEAKIVESAAGA